jgi:hypothetical protein
MTSDSPVIARIALGIVAAMALAIPFGITLLDAHEFELLEQTARTTDGRVTKKNCANHGRLAYSYVVDARVYSGAGTILGRSCDDVKIGDSIDIIYSVQKPRLSRCDSLATWRDQIFGSFLALALISLAAAIIIFRITRIDIETRTAHPW